MITDEERRRAVAELREASTGAYRHVDSLDVIAGAVGVEVAEKFSREVENETYAALADFIDRTTCENTSGHRDVFECSECRCKVEIVGENGNEYGEVFNTPLIPSFCPECGREVVEE